MKMKKATIKLQAAISICVWVSFCLLFGSSDVAYCGDCWCKPEIEEEACPTDLMPAIDFPQDWIDDLRKMKLENPMSLNCDIYREDGCDTVPPLEEGGACVAEIILASNVSICPEEFSYRLKTVESRAEAERNLQLVTHEGACGTCSTFQDLAVYMLIPDLSSVAIGCGFRAITNTSDGVACYQEAGFTEPCAKTWLSNNQQTGRECPMCIDHALRDMPPNRPPPLCELADCIACDDINSGPGFIKYAGRTRRNSGLLSAIVRPCGEISTIVQRDPCDETPLTIPPTTSPTTFAPSEAPTTLPTTSAPSASAPTTESPMNTETAATLSSGNIEAMSPFGFSFLLPLLFILF